MQIYDGLLSGREKFSVVGLGYVGMPIAVAFAAKGIHVVGFDLNAEKIALYQSGIDPTKEVGNDAIRNTTV
ncbi:MAG: nucleotide sugar dehydrogenase, partial [Clostridium lundense]|nr:nucleotide sugar dehydrogenase [Clostridium lundense]